MEYFHLSKSGGTSWCHAARKPGILTCKAWGRPQTAPAVWTHIVRQAHQEQTFCTAPWQWRRQRPVACLAGRCMNHATYTSACSGTCVPHRPPGHWFGAHGRLQRCVHVVMVQLQHSIGQLDGRSSLVVQFLVPKPAHLQSQSSTAAGRRNTMRRTSARYDGALPTAECGSDGSPTTFHHVCVHA
jgi:hypothetical protein